MHVTTQELPRLLTVRELSAQLGLRPDRIYRLASKGQIPVVRVARALRFSPAAVEEWIRAGGAVASPPPILNARRVRGSRYDFLEVDCPYCDRVHRHGAGPVGCPGGDGDGPRMPHCAPAMTPQARELGYVLREEVPKQSRDR